MSVHEKINLKVTYLHVKESVHLGSACILFSNIVATVEDENSALCWV